MIYRGASVKNLKINFLTNKHLYRVQMAFQSKSFTSLFQ